MYRKTHESNHVFFMQEKSQSMIDQCSYAIALTALAKRDFCLVA